MHLVLAGATGFIGTRLCRRLRADGHELRVLSRRAAGPGSVAWDGASPGTWRAALDGADAVINLCGENVAAGRWTEARKRALLDSRLRSTRALVDAIAASPRRPAALINASAVGYYGDRGETAVDEEAGPGEDFLARLCVDWETEALRARALGVRVACLRFGVVLGPGGGALARMLPIFRVGLGGPLGDGRQWLSWVSLEDAAGAIAHALSRPLSGPVNVTAPEPASNRDFAKALGRALRRPAVVPAPAFALRLALGEMAQMLLGGQRALPRRLQESGYRFVHPTLEAALAAALA